MPTTVFVLNGPNLNLLGQRESDIYGASSLEDIRSTCMEAGQRFGFDIDFRQTNNEGELVEWIQEAGARAAGIVINPAAYGHTSIAIHDAIRAIAPPVVEVHLSNIHAREEFRHRTMVAPVALGMICGFGMQGYVLAIEALAGTINK